MLDCSLVPAGYVDLFWGQVKIFLESTVVHSNGRYKVEDIYNAVIDESNKLWIAHIDGRVIGVATTQIVKYPQKTMLGICQWGGEEPLENWGPQMLELLKQYAKEVGCDGIEGYGRLGWSKRLKDFGYKKIHEVFELTI